MLVASLAGRGQERSSPGPGCASEVCCPAEGVLLHPPPLYYYFPPLFKFISLRHPGLSLLENYSHKSSLSSNYLNGGKGGEIHLESTSLQD